MGMFTCPVCAYTGRFRGKDNAATPRRDAACPECGALERHRLQSLTMDLMNERFPFAEMDMLHFAPHDCLRERYRNLFRSYFTVDLCRPEVDIHADAVHLPFGDGSFDCIYASHVLEHIADDRRALAEIRRVLRTPGFAVLPVPVVREKTLEYAEPNPREHGHVRAPGRDYVERYRPFFDEVREYDSREFPEEHQVYICAGAQGERHLEYVPVCLVNGSQSDRRQEKDRFPRDLEC